MSMYYKMQIYIQYIMHVQPKRMINAFLIWNVDLPKNNIIANAWIPSKTKHISLYTIYSHNLNKHIITELRQKSLSRGPPKQEIIVGITPSYIVSNTPSYAASIITHIDDHDMIIVCNIFVVNTEMIIKDTMRHKKQTTNQVTQSVQN